MKLPRRKFLHLAAGAAALPSVSRIAWAQSYPVRSITMVVPYAAGGGFDTIARIIGARMGELLGQTVIVENVTGAGGIIGVQRVIQQLSALRYLRDGKELDIPGPDLLRELLMKSTEIGELLKEAHLISA